MRLTRRIRIQMAILTVIATVAGSIMLFGYIKVPAMLGIGYYTVTVQLPNAGGLYETGNVTYRGTEVGRVKAVGLTATGVEATLSLRSDVRIPADVDAEVHSVSAVGEQYVALLPRSGAGPALKNGDVIPLNRTTVPQDINEVLAAANRGLQAIPHDNLKTVIDESYTAVGGLGPEISRIVNGTTTLAIDAHANLDPLTALIDRSKPVLDSQANTASAIQGWARHLSTITHQLQTNDTPLADLLAKGGPAADEGRRLIERVSPTVPVLLANLVSIGDVAVTYHPGIEQVLVLLPEGVADMDATVLADKNTKHPGLYLDFKLNLNVPPPCTTGFLPPQQMRTPNFEDKPDRPAGEIYCRVPQDSQLAVRGARNYPCETRPGKRAATVKLCESDEPYVPLNDGYNWKGDPNATLSGQSVPQLAPGSPAPAAAPTPQPPAAHPPSPPPIATAVYDPATGAYVGPDGRVYTQSNLAQSGKGKSWQTMLTPPNGR
jgi:phospholipid/cholesterol/gamma-HCH transport system substrate-binding protein